MAGTVITGTERPPRVDQFCYTVLLSIRAIQGYPLRVRHLLWEGQESSRVDGNEFVKIFQM
jgi:hypothetical protein